MKDSIAKVLPIVIGVAIGWLLFHPPAWMAPLGPLRYLVMGVLCLLVLLIFIAYAIGASIPADVAVTPHTGGVDTSMVDLAQRIRALGFAEAGPPYRIEVSPAATMIALAHPTEPVYATVFRTGTVPAVTSFDFVSILEGFRGGLTSNADPRGGTLPAGPGAFRQIIAGAGPEQVYRVHLEGVHWLRSRGLAAKKVSVETFVADFKQAMAKQREGFRSSPLKHALIALWRTVSKQVPNRGGLSTQSGAEAQVRELSMGRRG
jgi:hypothetical protein